MISSFIGMFYIKTICFVKQVFRVESAWNNIGILIVENASGIEIENSEPLNEVFCLKCYPSLYNGTFVVPRGKPDKNDMLDLSQLVDLQDVYSCDPQSFEDDLTNKV